MGDEKLYIPEFTTLGAVDVTTGLAKVSLQVNFAGQISAFVGTIQCRNDLKPEFGTASFKFEFKLPAATMTLSDKRGSTNGLTEIEISIRNLNGVTKLSEVDIAFISMTTGNSVSPSSSRLEYAIAGTANSQAVLKLRINSPVVDNAGDFQLIVSPNDMALPSVSSDFVLYDAGIEITNVTSMSGAACDSLRACTLRAAGGSKISIELLNFPYVSGPGSMLLTYGSNEVRDVSRLPDSRVSV